MRMFAGVRGTNGGGGPMAVGIGAGATPGRPEIMSQAPRKPREDRAPAKAVEAVSFMMNEIARGKGDIAAAQAAALAKFKTADTEFNTRLERTLAGIAALYAPTTRRRPA